MKILVSAYACEPGKGSEPEVGLRVVLAAASQHEVWVITRQNNLDSLEDFLQDHPLRGRIHLVGLDTHGLARRLKNRGGQATLHWYYDHWQRRLGDLAIQLDQDIDFDVVHHATFATYWTRAGVARVDKPLVWGPVGGGVNPPFALLPIAGLRGAVGDIMRLAVRPVVAALTGAKRTGRRARVILAQNEETASKFKNDSSVFILPNAISSVGAITVDSGSEPPTPGWLSAVCVGRLVGWKGVYLTLTAMHHLAGQRFSLQIFGDGPDRDRLIRKAKKEVPNADVQFMGTVQRDQVLKAVAQADVLVHSALHDESPLAVAEALALGTPVVMLNRGGPPIVAGYWPNTLSVAIEPSTPSNTAKRISEAVKHVAGQKGIPDAQPASLFTERLLGFYAAAASWRPSHR